VGGEEVGGKKREGKGTELIKGVFVISRLRERGGAGEI